MTEQEAMGYLQTLANRIPLKFYTDKGQQIYDDFSQVAIKALEKQIPKKMNPNFNCIFCDCGNPIYYQTDRLLHHYNYCCECGQAIKWE